MLEEEELKDAILLVFANKQDQRGALNARHVSGKVHRTLPTLPTYLPTCPAVLRQALLCLTTLPSPIPNPSHGPCPAPCRCLTRWDCLR